MLILDFKSHPFRSNYKKIERICCILFSEQSCYLIKILTLEVCLFTVQCAICVKWIRNRSSTGFRNFERRKHECRLCCRVKTSLQIGLSAESAAAAFAFRPSAECRDWPQNARNLIWKSRRRWHIKSAQTHNKYSADGDSRAACRN
jgi:hypothetical protein